MKFYSPSFKKYGLLELCIKTTAHQLYTSWIMRFCFWRLTSGGSIPTCYTSVQSFKSCQELLYLNGKNSKQFQHCANIVLLQSFKSCQELFYLSGKNSKQFQHCMQILFYLCSKFQILSGVGKQ